MSKINKLLFKTSFAIINIFFFISCGTSNNGKKMEANAGNDIFLTSPEIIELNGSISVSSDNNPQYSWELYSKPKNSKATLSNHMTAKPTISIDKDGDYLFELTINDGKKILKDRVKTTLNSLCEISSDVKFETSISKKVFQPQIKGLKDDINGTFVYFNHIQNAHKYQLGIYTKFGYFEILDTKNKVAFQFANDKLDKYENMSYIYYPYISDIMMIRSSHFNIKDKIALSLKAFDVNNNLIVESKKISFTLGENYQKNALKVHFSNIFKNEKINLSWCPTKSNKDYILHYGKSFDNLDKTMPIKTSSSFKTSIEHIDKQNAQYLSISHNGFFSNIINTMPSYSTDNINFSISKVTFNQSVQIDMDNNINNTPVISGKSGVLRVFTTIENGSSAYKVKVKLSGSNNGEELKPIIKTVILQNSDFNSTDSTNKPITFHINNPDWLKVGTKFYIEIDSNDEIKESNENDNRYPKDLYKSFGFQNVNKMKVHLIPINAIYGYVNIPSSYIVETKEVLESMYPLSNVDIVIEKPINLVHNTINTPTRLLNMLENVVEYRDYKITEDNINKDVYYVGVVDNLKFRDIGGIGKLNDKEDIDLASVVRINDVSKYSFAQYIAHEIGHNHSLRHIDNSDEKSCAVPSGTDNNYPYNQENKKYGRIGKTSYINYKNIFYDKNLYHDVMTYCPKRWISDYSYSKLYNFEKKLDKVYSRNIKRSITNDTGSLVDGKTILGRFNNNIWKITKKYSSKGKQNIPKIKTNLYLQVIFDDSTKMKIPFQLSNISHIKLKMFKVFIPSLKNIKSIDVINRPL